METTRVCPDCGSPLPPDAPEGICPECLMKGGLEQVLDRTITSDGSRDRNHPEDRLKPGDRFGEYRIEQELGRGGMGVVYEAVQLDTDRRVALKVLSHQLNTPELQARFLREGRLAASINHPNSVYVYGTGEIEGTPVISMELVSGGTLQDRVKRDGPLPVGPAVDAIVSIISGLAEAQKTGILHRDIKPANCFEDVDGTVKIGDFGLSISTEAHEDQDVTADGV
ncbi:MAG: protein kinase, partial [Verrucomicrobiota bacterium]